MRDSEIEQWVLRELGQHRNGNSKEICVYVTDGIVTLKGSVRTRYEKSTVQKTALRADAVIAVVNHLKVVRFEPTILPAIRVPNNLRLQIEPYQLPVQTAVARTQSA
jgi:BON domain-containing protein